MLEYCVLANDIVLLEPFDPQLKEEVRTTVHQDEVAWAIMPSNPIGDRFESFWAAACAASPRERLAYAVRRRADGQVVGISSFYTSLADQGGVEVGTTYLQPDARGGSVNPAVKLLMLSHAFGFGMVRVQFRVDTRNLRSQAAVAKLGATREGVLRKDRATWTGFIRDTVYYSIIDDEWPEVRRRLSARITGMQAEVGRQPPSLTDCRG